MAVDIWNFLEVEWCTNNILQETSIEVYGEGSDELATDTSNLVYQAMKFLFLEAGHQVPAVRLSCENNIPLSRGLGSSAAAISSGLVAANFMVGNLFEPNELLEMAAKGNFIGTFTGRHGENADYDHPQPGIWTLGPIQQQLV